MAALEALVIVSKLGPHPLVTLINVAGMALAVVPRADVIPRQVVLAAHPTGSGGSGSE